MLSLRPCVLIVMFGLMLTLNHLPEPENNAQDREYLVYQSKLAERAERYKDIAESMKQVTELDIKLSVEERKSLALAYNHVIVHRRASLRKLTSTDNEADNNDTRKVEMLMNYRERITKEIKEICETVLVLLNVYLIPDSTSRESQVFFFTMKGDCYRYVAEVEEGAGRKSMEETALVAYESASDIANAELAPTNPIRLKLALNFSIFHYEILNSPDKACRLAKAAIDEASAELDVLSDANYKDSVLIMQLLYDKLALWSLDKTSEDIYAFYNLE